jgi:hypothetical protein
MKKPILYILLSLFAISQLPAQKKFLKKSQVSLNIPIIWNHTEVLDVFKETIHPYISGKAFSYGLNAAYNYTVVKGLYITGSFGFFNQRFGIGRPSLLKVVLDSGISNKPIYSPEHYGYYSLDAGLGIGCRVPISKEYTINAALAIHNLYTFHQRYVTGKGKGTKFNMGNKYNFGQRGELKLGAMRNINGKYAAGFEFLVPFYNRWRKDDIFNENNSEYHKPFKTAGINLSILRNF